MTGARERLLDPTGESDQATDRQLSPGGATPRTPRGMPDEKATISGLRPRLRSLRGLRVALLENTKPNGAVLLQHVGRELQERYGVREARMFRKGYFGTPVEESVVQQILRDCDFAVAGIGD